MNAVTGGPSLMIEGLRTLWRRDIRWLVLIPLLINIVLFAVGTGFAASWLQNWITTITTSVPDWLQWLAWAIWFLFTILALAIYSFTFTILANLVGSPFYGVIAQRVIVAEVADNQSNALNEIGLLRGAWNSLVRELQLIGYFLPRTVVVGIMAVMLSFIPVVNLLAPIIAGGWAAWCLCLQYLDYAADSQGVTFLALRKKVSGNRLNSIGFGLSAMLASAIPLVNLVMLPASVVAGSLLWCRQHRDMD
ncbi:sulfate transporter CysZ [Gammaproteobacteria bacterium]|nr:sulfate transporter CysZ [Gammaproteobacteria bacterium]